MKLRARRLAVQRRMREAPSADEMLAVFVRGMRWTKRDLKKLAARKPVPLMFNVIPLRASDGPPIKLPVPQGAAAAIASAMDDMMTKGIGWFEVGVR